MYNLNVYIFQTYLYTLNDMHTILTWNTVLIWVAGEFGQHPKSPFVPEPAFDRVFFQRRFFICQHSHTHTGSVHFLYFSFFIFTHFVRMYGGWGITVRYIRRYNINRKNLVSPFIYGWRLFPALTVSQV